MDNKTKTGGVKGWFLRHKPSKRRLIQVYAALLYNANLKGFSTGEIYKGDTKNFCVPGLNCYSCPGAVGACPLGSLQNALAAGNASSLTYILGILVLFGLLLGRTICGFLCPFGLVQELLHKIPSPKLKKNKVTKVLSYFKYVLLGALVIMIPLAYSSKLAVPGFCKYICPDGILFGAIGLLSNVNNSNMFAMLGPLFTWKFCLLVAFIVGSIFIFRCFCRFFCPLGAIYGFFCKVALLGVKLDESKCVQCGKCVEECQMDIRHVGDHECISCGKCISVCPTKAIRWNGSKFFVADPTAGISKDMTEADIARVNAHNDKLKKRRKVCRIIAVVLAIVLLGTAIWYYNFRSDGATPDPIPDTTTSPTEGPDTTEGTDTTEPVEVKEYGKDVGQYCPDFTVTLFDGTAYTLSENLGKITVINFWATWCGPCKAELPEFNDLAGEYADQVTVLALTVDVEKNYQKAMDTAADWTNLVLGYDPDYALVNTIGGNPQALPNTLVLDQEGKIIFTYVGALSYEELLAAIAPALTTD